MPAPSRGKRALAVAASVVATTLVTVAGDFTQSSDAVALGTIVGFYLATAGIITAFAVWTAGEVGLPSFLLLQPLGARERLRRLAVYGLGVGALLSVGSVLLAGEGDAALQPWFWRRIQSQAGIVLLSARAALLEETFFRLFLIPLLVSIAVRSRRPVPRYRIRLREGTLRATRTQQPGAEPGAPPWALVAAVIGSSLLFGLAHPFNPLPAMCLAPLLALAYLRGGWESAVLAHFTADWLVFSFYF